MFSFTEWVRRRAEMQHRRCRRAAVRTARPSVQPFLESKCLVHNRANLYPVLRSFTFVPAPVLSASSQCDPEPAASDCDPIPASQALILEERPRLNSWQMHDPSACLRDGLVCVCSFGAPESRFGYRWSVLTPGVRVLQFAIKHKRHLARSTAKVCQCNKQLQ